ncbi:MAG: DciA family protein [Candidatus Thiodiazotropha sp.]
MRKLQQFISSHATLATLGQRLSRQRALLDQVRGLLPSPLSTQLQAAVLEARTLSLFVDSPVWASRLRYLAPELMRKLKQQDLIVDQVRTRIVPESRRSNATRGRQRLQLSAQSAEQLRQTAVALTDEPLREAMLRLSRHGRKN